MESDERLAALLGIDASMLALARLMAPDLSTEFVERLRNAGADAQAAEENAVSLQNAVLLCSDEATRDKTMQGLHAAGALPVVLGTLRAHPSRLEIVNACVCLLRELGATSAEVAREAVEAGGIEAVAAAVTAHAADVKVVENACAALWHFSGVGSESHVPELEMSSATVRYHAPAVGAVLAAMRSGALANSVAAKSTLNLATRLERMHPRFAEELCSADSLCLALAVLSAHGDCALVQGQGVTLLSRMCDTQPQLRAEAEQNGVLEAVVAALRLHGSKSEEVARACCMLLATLPRAAAAHVARLGCVEALCATLRTQFTPPKAESATVLCSLLHSWCSERTMAKDDAAKMQNRRRAIAAGAVGWLVAVLKVKRANAEVMQLAAAALRGLVFASGRLPNDPALDTFGAAGVVEATVAVMEAFPKDANIVLECAAVLSHLCISPQMRLRAVQAGALPLLVRGLRAATACGTETLQRQGASALCQYCLGAIANVCSANDATKLAAGAAGAVEAVVAALQACAGKADTIRYGCTALLNLTKDVPPNQRRAGAAGVMPVLVAALRAHAAADATLSSKIATALANTTGGIDANRVAAASAGAIPALVAAMRAAPAHSELQEMCAVGLGNVCMESQARQGIACDAGALDLLVTAIRAHPGASSMQCNAALAIGNLTAGCRSLVTKAGAAGAVEAVVAVLHREGGKSVSAAHDGLFALGHLSGTPANAARAAAAGAFAAIVAAQRAAAADADVTQCAWDVAGLIVGTGVAAQAEKAAADGVLPALVACLQTGLAETRRYAAVHNSGAMLLSLLCERGGEAVAAHAVRAGALALWAEASTSAAATFRTMTQRALQAAAKAHDAAATCGDAACARCAELRAQGLLCGLPGCGAKQRDGGDAKKLLRCTGCHTLAFCCAAHQREDWARHKPECGELKRKAAASSAA